MLEADILTEVKFQLSLLRISLLGAETPQAEELENVLNATQRLFLRSRFPA